MSDDGDNDSGSLPVLLVYIIMKVVIHEETYIQTVYIDEDLAYDHCKHLNSTAPANIAYVIEEHRIKTE